VTFWADDGAVIVIWHDVWAAISNWVWTVIVDPAQVRVTEMGALEATAQVPGPRRGTSATARSGLS
jgi:hypothetical protein